MTNPYTGFWGFVDHWQTLIAGVLAFIAGFLAYCAGKEQAKAVIKQNDDLKTSEKRRLARSALISARLLEGVLAGIEQDIENEITYVSRGNDISEGNGQDVSIKLASASRKRIMKPDISLVWEQLGNLDPDIIRKYMVIDREISKLWNTESSKDPSINSILGEFRSISQIVRSVRLSIENESQKANKVLLEIR